MHFCHSSEIWNDYRELVPGVIAADQITPDVSILPRLARFTSIAEGRLASYSEGELPEIQAWRRTFSRMGLKPTQYRCASESLLRRYRKERSLPQIHPLIDLCNVVSLAFAIPIAVFDVAKIAGYLEVRYSVGSEVYESFSGETEHPEAHEVIFADGANKAHARRLDEPAKCLLSSPRQHDSGLIVVEAMHASAKVDVQRILTALAEELHAVWSVSRTAKTLTSTSPRFELPSLDRQ